jgi:hypothetical protein
VPVDQCATGVSYISTSHVLEVTAKRLGPTQRERQRTSASERERESQRLPIGPPDLGLSRLMTFNLQPISQAFYSQGDIQVGALTSLVLPQVFKYSILVLAYKIHRIPAITLTSTLKRIPRLHGSEFATHISPHNSPLSLSIPTLQPSSYVLHQVYP